jgi:hypothetical protein
MAFAGGFDVVDRIMPIGCRVPIGGIIRRTGCVLFRVFHAANETPKRDFSQVTGLEGAFVPVPRTISPGSGSDAVGWI